MTIFIYKSDLNEMGLPSTFSKCTVEWILNNTTETTVFEFTDIEKSMAETPASVPRGVYVPCKVTKITLEEKSGLIKVVTRIPPNFRLKLL